MGMYETDNGVWWQIAGFLAATAILITAVNWLLRKILGVERKKFFSAESNYVNAMHHKVNDYFRWGNVVLYLFLLIVYGFERGSLYFFVATLVLGELLELFNAYMERKHSENPNDYKFTLLQLPAGLMIVGICAAFFLPDVVEVFKATFS